MNKNVAIILAAGKGSRIGAGVNKQFINIGDNPILYYTLKAFEESEDIDEILVIAAKNEVEYCKESIVREYNFKKVIDVIEGGKERQDSVLNGLNYLEKCSIVLIHDGARPFVSKRIIREGIMYAEKYGAAACGVMPVDTIKIVDDEGFGVETLNRKELVAIQTPQIFKYDIIKKSHNIIKEQGMVVTDDTMVAEKCGNKVYTYEGDYNNIKITNKMDLLIAEEILKNLFTNNKDNV